MMKNDEKNRNIIFYFPFSQNAKKKSFDKLAQKKKKKNTNTNNPKRVEEQEAFVRSSWAAASPERRRAPR